MKWLKEQEAACNLRDHEDVLLVTKNGLLMLGEWIDATPPQYFSRSEGWIKREDVRFVLRVDDLEIPYVDCIITNDKWVDLINKDEI